MMRRKINKIMAVILTLMSFGMTWLTKAEALEPRLLWEKRLKFDVTSLGLAKNTGDVIVSGKHAREIIIFDKDGSERFHWGPRIDRQPHEVSISDDGSYFIYVSSWTESFKEKMKKEDWDNRLHYVQKKGKELWSKPSPPYTWATLSPNGKYIAFAGVPGEGGDIELWDSIGKKLWIHESSSLEDFEFSPNSEYLIANEGGGIELIDLSGNTLLEGDAGFVITSVATDANYIATSEGSTEKGVRLLDKQGNIILQGGPDDLTLVSGDGSKGILWDKDGYRIYNLPVKILIKTYPIKPESRQTYSYPSNTSFDGRYFALAGSKISSLSANNIFVIDLVEDKVWETVIPNPKLLELYLTNDGKYLLIKNDEAGIKSILYYYQIF